MPVGTQLLDEDRETVLADFTMPGQRQVFLRGGDGGRGNLSYKTSTNRAPRQHGPGWPGEEMWVWLRLKLLADAGLVGLPNAGKSTFINAVTNAKAKVGDYPFTTIRPQLGVVSHRDREFVVADIPGLIEGAADGAGIGDRFLGHIERCRVLLHLVDATSEDPIEAYHIVREELAAYGVGPRGEGRGAGAQQGRCDRRGDARRADGSAHRGERRHPARYSPARAAKALPPCSTNWSRRSARWAASRPRAPNRARATSRHPGPHCDDARLRLSGRFLPSFPLASAHR